MRCSCMKYLAVILATGAVIVGCSETPTDQQNATPSPAQITGVPSSHGEGTGEVIATGLNNPRHLALGPTGSLYVAEAGLGAGSEESGAEEGLGYTGSVTMINRPASARPEQHRVLTGLVSAAELENGELDTIGPDGIGFARWSAVEPMYLSFGAHGPAGLGLLVQYSSGGTATTVADVGAADFAWTGDHSDLWEESPTPTRTVCWPCPGTSTWWTPEPTRSTR